MASKGARNLYGDRTSPPTLSARINRRKQRARKIEEGASLWERVRSKRDELVNQARTERDQSATATQAGRTRFEQVVKEALQARDRQRENDNLSPWRNHSSPDLSVYINEEDKQDSGGIDSPKKGTFQEDKKHMNNDLSVKKRSHGVPKMNQRRTEYRPPPARNPSPTIWPSSFDTDTVRVDSREKVQPNDPENEDWQEGKSLKECNLYMLTYEIDCDITFLVGDTKEALRGHKYMLTSRNSKFSKILHRFRGEMDTLLSIPDIQPDIFKELIKYIYTDEIELNVRLATALLYPAFKFGVTSLLRTCFEFLMSEMSSDNVCKILENAHTYNEQNIYDKCLRFIYVNAVDVLKTPNFRDLCRECVTEIVKSDDLLADETDVYDALINWANGECARSKRKLPLNDANRREVLGDLLFCSRFPLMDVNVFSHRISKQNVLRSDEKISLFQYFHGEVNTLPDRFNRKGRRKYSINREILARADGNNCDIERQIPTPKHNQYSRRAILPPDDTNQQQFTGHIPSYDNVYVEPDQPVLRVVRYKSIAGPWNLNSPDAVSFRCSSTIILRGVQVFGPYKGTDYYSVTLSVFDEFRNEIRKKEMNIFTNKAKVYDVILHEPVRIPKQRIFTVQIVMKGKPTIHGTEGVAVVVTEDVQFEFINSNRSMNGTDVTTGQIPALLFSKP